MLLLRSTTDRPPSVGVVAINLYGGRGLLINKDSLKANNSWKDQNTSIGSGFLHRSCLESFIVDFRIAFLGEFAKEDAQIWQRYGDIPNQSEAGVFKVRISLVWHQFQLEQYKVTSRRLGIASLVNFLDSQSGD